MTDPEPSEDVAPVQKGTCISFSDDEMRVTYEFDEKFDFVGNGMDLDEEISVWIKAANSLLEFSPGSRDPKLEQQAINGFTRIMLSIDCMLEITEIDDENLTIYSALLRRQMNILSCCFSLRPNYKTRFNWFKVVSRVIFDSNVNTSGLPIRVFSR
ncbi:hypothetical protein NLI96_g7869 [Meripilus lineatus]|uniref:Uncharacterized protein n=1 Tax=Meripilus lineatus TaxID=2056292 RepID=A0AAD5UZZ9_9APHY|nr:hypothetical protein NLI96_g7869 [Physisporinus lineatus]